jgi:hypothetical protein
MLRELLAGTGGKREEVEETLQQCTHPGRPPLEGRSECKVDVLLRIQANDKGGYIDRLFPRPTSEWTLLLRCCSCTLELDTSWTTSPP